LTLSELKIYAEFVSFASKNKALWKKNTYLISKNNIKLVRRKQFLLLKSFYLQNIIKFIRHTFDLIQNRSNLSLYLSMSEAK